MRTVRYFLAFFSAFISPSFSPADSTLPATRPAADELLAQIARNFTELAHPDVSVRHDAKVALMALRREDLPLLQKFVATNQPLLPSQAAVLRDIVIHVYLHGEPYDSADQAGFLGVRQLALGIETPEPPQTDSPAGVMIMERMPGFCGFGVLMDGDVVLRIAERPELQLRGRMEFSDAIQKLGAHKQIHLDIVRAGQVIRVPVTLDARPDAAAQDAVMEDLLRRRRVKGEQYWNQYFAAMLKEKIS